MTDEIESPAAVEDDPILRALLGKRDTPVPDAVDADDDPEEVVTEEGDNQ